MRGDCVAALVGSSHQIVSAPSLASFEGFTAHRLVHRYGGGGGCGGGGGSSNHGGYTSSGDSDRSAMDAARLAAMLSASGIDLQSLISSAGLGGGQVRSNVKG